MPILTPQQSQGPEPGPDRMTTEPSEAPSATAPRPPLAIDSMPPVGSPEPPETDRAPGGGRRRWWLLAAAVVLVAGAGVAVALLGSSSDDGATEAATAPIQAVQAEQRDLVEFRELDATLGFAADTLQTAGRDGTVTAAADEGDSLERGDVAFEIGGQPTVVFYGSTPLYRELTSGVDDGADVLVLEENLAALGFDADGELVVDETFDAATTAAIEAWQAGLGVEETGAVTPADALVVGGPSLVSSVQAEVGAAVNPGAPVLTTSLTAETQTVLAGGDGRLTLVPSVGQTISSGDVLYELDTEPVAVIVGDEPLDRQLNQGVEDGEDVEQLERALVELGYDADGELEVDETFDEATFEAVQDWEDDLGIGADGVIQVGQYLVLEPGQTVLEVEAERGDDVTATSLLAVVGSSTREITTEIEVADQDLISEGDAVEIELPDGATTTGQVTDVAAS
ncbi:MAG: peptidoglycan-binding domain-containing protein, partial [Actinomycetota bacterium]